MKHGYWASRGSHLDDASDAEPGPKTVRCRIGLRAAPICQSGVVGSMLRHGFCRFSGVSAEAYRLLSTPSMQTTPSVTTRHDATPDEGAQFWRRLFYRWFVEYNPLYLVSAALVLGGCSLWARGLVDRDSLAGPLGIAAVAELYAISLALGAALLTRIGLRRPAVMLSLLFVLYHWDMTLHTETCAYLGTAGALATCAWFLMFVVKLYAIAWALRVNLSRHVVAPAIVAAAGLALAPRVLPSLGERGGGALLAVWIFALVALYRPDGVASVDGWGQLVLRRVTRAAWLLSGALVGAHVFFWFRDHNLSLFAAFLAVPLLIARRIRGEARMWALVLCTLFFAAEVQPSAFFVIALLAAASLCLRAMSPSSPLIVGAPERGRLLSGALFAGYLALWTLHWSGGSWPAHSVGLDLCVTVAVALMIWRSHIRCVLLPLAACYCHLVLQAHLLPMPSSVAAWGEAAVALGFALLAGSLFTSYRLRERDHEW
jgi:hypothetical protein